MFGKKLNTDPDSFPLASYKSLHFTYDYQSGIRYLNPSVYTSSPIRWFFSKTLFLPKIVFFFVCQIWLTFFFLWKANSTICGINGRALRLFQVALAGILFLHNCTLCTYRVKLSSNTPLPKWCTSCIYYFYLFSVPLPLLIYILRKNTWHIWTPIHCKFSSMHQVIINCTLFTNFDSLLWNILPVKRTPVVYNRSVVFSIRVSFTTICRVTNIWV